MLAGPRRGLLARGDEREQFPKEMIVLIKITPEAVEALEALREDALAHAEELPTDAEPTLRLVLGRQHALVILDALAADDEVVECNGHAVLCIDPGVEAALAGTIIGVAHTTHGDRLAWAV
ncbi:MAG: hypothetical protein M0Z94_20150 [Dehalococcoidales bacterium]|nr:hypothetical protein [Dehalococcoidales bacterium]